MIGLIEPDQGQVIFDGEPITSQNVMLVRRKIGYVIQDGGLFPHLSARDNVGLLAKYLGWDKPRVAARVEELADLTRLPREALDRYPAQLSGGEQQRDARRNDDSRQQNVATKAQQDCTGRRGSLKGKHRHDYSDRHPQSQDGPKSEPVERKQHRTDQTPPRLLAVLVRHLRWMAVPFQHSAHFLRAQLPPQRHRLIFHLRFQVGPHLCRDVLHLVRRQHHLLASIGGRST
jgi:hypothetical protein